ncbi:hypothetical protein [Streptomyces fulvoviolaceus]|uniref:hypothetical protein n=1 Tax=Streptomyces fulvoviolaceus TaxID=285535 RepID=UPI001F4156E6|nr:hypothetical protein [Streptomyces fulvoviolaceus]
MPFQPFARDWDRVQAVVDTEQWNWLAIEISEIRRCAAVGDQAHDRLALLLVDHLVEVIVGREVNAQLALQLPDSLIGEMKESRDNGVPLSAMLDKAVEEHVGPEQRKRIDDNLRDKTRYLTKKKVLTSQECEVLDRMHEYRNATYHRETLEAGLISDLVLAYMILASQLLARHKPIAWVMATSKPGPVVQPHELSGLLADGLEMDLMVVAERFSDHTVKRVDNIATAVVIAQTLLDPPGDDIQIPAPDDDFGRLLTSISKEHPRLRSWTKRASDLKTKTTSLLDLMIPFINLDRALSPVEPSVKRLQMILDWWEQRQLDEIRGK